MRKLLLKAHKNNKAICARRLQLRDIQPHNVREPPLEVIYRSADGELSFETDSTFLISTEPQLRLYSIKPATMTDQQPKLYNMGAVRRECDEVSREEII